MLFGASLPLLVFPFIVSDLPGLEQSADMDLISRFTKVSKIAIFPANEDMKIVIQRTAGVEVVIDGHPHSRTEAGLLVLFGTMKGDAEASCGYLADKAVNLRIFEDAQGKMNLSALDVGAEIMVVSQFTLYADTSKGRRPGFDQAMHPTEAEPLYDRFIELVTASELVTKSGVFGAGMDLRFTNHGPVTIIIEHVLLSD